MARNSLNDHYNPECRRSFHVGRGTSWMGAAEALAREFDMVGTPQFLKTHHVWRDHWISCVPTSCKAIPVHPLLLGPPIVLSCPYFPLVIAHWGYTSSSNPVSKVFQICSILSIPWQLPAFRSSSFLPWNLLTVWLASRRELPLENSVCQSRGPPFPTTS